MKYAKIGCQFALGWCIGKTIFGVVVRMVDEFMDRADAHYRNKNDAEQFEEQVESEYGNGLKMKIGFSMD